MGQRRRISCALCPSVAAQDGRRGTFSGSAEKGGAESQSSGEKEAAEAGAGSEKIYRGIPGGRKLEAGLGTGGTSGRESLSGSGSAGESEGDPFSEKRTFSGRDEEKKI